ncbi:MAG TPA: AIPR family protein [Firmicutes bacterium]|nr:AIPR family protein [Bacillota bacterium]
MSNSFKSQIESDIAEYKESHPNIPNIHKDEWAFNYWVLDKLFFEDEEIIESKIIDYSDYGTDAYEFYEDTKDVYLIQNKYYSDDSIISADYVKNDFLIRTITALENGTYKKAPELQSFFNKYKDDSDFTVYLQLFVTNNRHCIEADEYIKEFNLKHPKYRAKIFYLDNIEERYYNEVKEIKKNLKVTIESINNGTILNINNAAYKLENVIDAKYVFTPVVSVFKMYEDALKQGYPIFDKNIREYLGNTGVNKNIYNTLMSPTDRKNFFYYNNGITIICDKIDSTVTKVHTGTNLSVSFNIHNPQIVNGCQTVNSIYEVLKNTNPAELYNQFKDTFVMLKILQIDRISEEQQALYQNIVKYNNSQNSIDEKTFVSNKGIFSRLQNEFEKRGFLLLIKQSDKNKFANDYKVITKLKEANSQRVSRFGLTPIKKAKDVFIPLEKLLQVICAFASGGYIAYVKKSNMLKYNSEQYNTAVNFIKSINSIDTLLDLYLLYKRAEEEKSKKSDSRAPIPYYLIDCFARYECKERTAKRILPELSSNDKIEYIIRLYTAVTKAYTKEYFAKNNVDYNKMIKQPIKYDILDNQRDILSEVI